MNSSFITSGQVLLRNPIVLCFAGGGGGLDPLFPSGSAHGCYLSVSLAYSDFSWSVLCVYGIFWSIGDR